jgi:hypothetical protein
MVVDEGKASTTSSERLATLDAFVKLQRLKELIGIN